MSLFEYCLSRLLRKSALKRLYSVGVKPNSAALRASVSTAVRAASACPSFGRKPSSNASTVLESRYSPSLANACRNGLSGFSAYSFRRSLSIERVASFM